MNNKPNHFLKSSLTGLALAFCAADASANLVTIGNGLVLDTSDGVYWTDGLYFTNAMENNPGGTPALGLLNGTTNLIGTTVNDPSGNAHTLTTSDFSYYSVLMPHGLLADWYGATAYAQNLSYTVGSTQVTGWSLPTVADLQSLWNQLGTYGINPNDTALLTQYPNAAVASPQTGATDPFNYTLPKIWTTDGATDTPSGSVNGPNGFYVDFTKSNQGQAVYEGNLPLTNQSNVWAVYNGPLNLQALAAAPVPVPGAAWLFGSALAGAGLLRSRRR